MNRQRMFLSHKSCLTLTAERQAPLSSISWSLLKFMSIELVMLSNHLILCHPLHFLPSVFHSLRVFFSESALCIRHSKYWSFSFSSSPSSEYSGLISFGIDLFDLLAVQWTLKSLLQHHFSKASTLLGLAAFRVQMIEVRQNICQKKILLTVGKKNESKNIFKLYGKIMKLFGKAFRKLNTDVLSS